MGNDGGTIASRKDIVSLHLLNKRADTTSEDVTKINYCKLSSFPLKSEKVVGDYKGNLYIKEKMLIYLIEKKQSKDIKADDFNHITSLRDLVDVNISWLGDLIQCPILKDTVSVYVYLRPCGCVISHKALFLIKKVLNIEKGEANCPSCDVVFHFDHDVVVINPSTEEYKKFNNENYEHLREMKVSHNKKKLRSRQVETTKSGVKRQKLDTTPQAN